MYDIFIMALNPIFCRTIDGQPDLSLFNLDVNGTATINNLDIEMTDITAVTTLTITDSTGNTLQVNSTTDSTSTSTGSVKLLGGLAVAKNLSTNSLRIYSTLDSTSSSTGSLTLLGGMGVMKKITCGDSISALGYNLKSVTFTSNGNDLFLNANSDIICIRPTAGTSASQLSNSALLTEIRNTSGTSIFTVNKTSNQTSLKSLQVTDTIASTSTSTGSLIVNSGVGVGGNLSGTTAHFYGTVTSTSKTTGTLIVDGGIGISGRISTSSLAIENSIFSSSNTNDLIISANNDTIYQRPGGTSNSEFSNSVSSALFRNTSGTSIFNLDKATNLTTLVKLVISDTSDSSSTNTGSAIVNGGLGVALNISSTSMHLYGTLASTSKSTGTLIVDGGAGFSGRVSTQSISIQNVLQSSTNNNDLIISTASDSIYLRPSGSTNSEFLNGVNEMTVRNTSGSSILSVDKVSNLTSLSKLQLTDTTDSISTSTGALVVPGGVGISKKLYVGDLVSCQALYVKNGRWVSNGNDVFIVANNEWIYLDPTSSGNAVMINAPTFLVVRNVGTTDIFTIDKTTEITSIKSLNVYDTTSTTSSTTGAIKSAGGISVSNSTNASSSTNGGSITTEGGFAAAKDAYIGGILQSGNITCPTISLTGSSGTFTPTLDSDTTITYTTQFGSYYFISNLVFVTISITTTSAIYLAAGQQLRIEDLPFNSISESGANTILPAPYFENYDLPSSTDYLVSKIAAGENAISFWAIRDGLGTDFVVAPTTVATRKIQLSFTFRK
jgi:hypothetical protein